MAMRAARSRQGAALEELPLAPAHAHLLQPEHGLVWRGPAELEQQPSDERASESTVMTTAGPSPLPAKDRRMLPPPAHAPSTSSSTVAPATPHRCSRSQTRRTSALDKRVPPSCRRAHPPDVDNGPEGHLAADQRAVPPSRPRRGVAGGAGDRRAGAVVVVCAAGRGDRRGRRPGHQRSEIVFTRWRGLYRCSRPATPAAGRTCGCLTGRPSRTAELELLVMCARGDMHPGFAGKPLCRSWWRLARWDYVAATGAASGSRQAGRGGRERKLLPDCVEA